MVWSKYNFLLDKDNRYFLYNSYTNNLLELEYSDYQSLKWTESNKSLANLDKDFISELVEVNALVEDDDSVYEKIKLVRLKNRYRSDVLSLTIVPTLSCNLACPYCFESNQNQKTMSKEIEDELIEYIKSFSGISVLSVTWYGGEPLLAFDQIIRLSDRINQMDISHINFSIITNGYLLDAMKISELKRIGFRSIQITLDGSEETHNRKRPHKSKTDSYSHILNNIKLLNELFPEVFLKVRVNLDKNKLCDFKIVQDQIKTIADNPNYQCYSAIIKNFNEGSCTFDDSVLCQQEESEFLLKNAGNAEIKDRLFPISKPFDCTMRTLQNVVIGPSGEFYKCWCDVGKMNKSYGDVRVGVTNPDMLAKLMSAEDQLFDGKCKVCSYFPICDGGCSFLRIKNPSSSENCTVQKNRLEKFIFEYLKS